MWRLLTDAAGIEVHLTKQSFWETFPTWPVAVVTLAVCGFASVYFLGAKGFCTYAWVARGGAPGPRAARIGRRQSAAAQAMSLRRKASQAAIWESSMYSSGRWAWSMEPGPQTTAEKPASWNSPPSVP